MCHNKKVNRLVYVVIDSMGSGRVVGVFSARKRASAVAKANPLYYSMHECRLNTLSKLALEWAPSEQIREALQDAAEG